LRQQQNKKKNTSVKKPSQKKGTKRE
jgi:hypothetical protein